VQAAGQAACGTIRSAVSWQTAHVGRDYDTLAPDGSEIRLLVQVRAGSLVHCTLPPGQITRAVRHKTVEEVWLCLAGHGQVWRHSPEANIDDLTDLTPGTSVSIPLGTHFQFRAAHGEPLEIAITTMPLWPGADEAVPVEGTWQPTL
jgi:mannose-6-phosphate isomerase-like protein (cupin superfamily)